MKLWPRPIWCTPHTRPPSRHDIWNKAEFHSRLWRKKEALGFALSNQLQSLETHQYTCSCCWDGRSPLTQPAVNTLTSNIRRTHVSSQLDMCYWPGSSAGLIAELHSRPRMESVYGGSLIYLRYWTKHQGQLTSNTRFRRANPTIPRQWSDSSIEVVPANTDDYFHRRCDNDDVPLRNLHENIASMAYNCNKSLNRVTRQFVKLMCFIGLSEYCSW